MKGGDGNFLILSAKRDIKWQTSLRKGIRRRDCKRDSVGMR